MSKEKKESKPSYEELASRVKELEGSKGTSFKVSEKGAVSMYGLRRFPITFYASEWDVILDQSDKIKKFIKENKSKLKTK